MSTLCIQIVSVDIGQGMTKTKKPYKFLDVVYKNKSYQDKIENKKIMPFGSKEVMDTLETASKGDVFYVVREKNEGGFWDWTNIEESPPEDEKPVNTAKPALKQSYDQKDDQKQLFIIRQSSLTNAVNTLAAGIDPDNVKVVAQNYIDFVFGNNIPTPVDSSDEEDYID